jgi:hypothetical protein
LDGPVFDDVSAKKIVGISLLFFRQLKGCFFLLGGICDWISANFLCLNIKNHHGFVEYGFDGTPLISIKAMV